MNYAVEAYIARNMVRRAVYIGPVLLALFWVVRGTGGLAASAIGLAVVIGNFLLAGAMLSVAARISLSLYHATALFGFFLRLALITLTVLVVSRLYDVDRIALGITVVVAYLALLGWEAVAVARGSEREVEWSR